MDIANFLATDLPKLCQSEPSDESGYALPERSLRLLANCATALKVRSALEFGSGQSTKWLIEAGCEVTAVEDSPEWQAQTMALLGASQRARFNPILQPLERVWLSGVPLRGWRLPDAVLDRLRDATLVLIDSPAWPPFREYALATALIHCRNALVVLDDANIPTVSRFCRRLAERNGLQSFQTTMDHGLFCIHVKTTERLDFHRPILENLKAWRRYFIAPTTGA